MAKTNNKKSGRNGNGHMNLKKQNSEKEKQKVGPKPKQNKVAEQMEQKKQIKLLKEHKIAIFKKKRLEKIKVISKKTSRGQPLMKDRVEYLLKQIQEMKRT